MNAIYQHSVPQEIIDLLNTKTRLRLYFLIEAVLSNPNGDPANGNRPRTDYFGIGYISDASLKRIARDAAARQGEDLYFERGVNLADKKVALLGEKNPCKKFWDLPLFGGIIGDNKRVRGAMVVKPPRTSERLHTSDVRGTRTSTDSGKGGKKVQEDGTEDKGGGNMGSRPLVDYALYEGWADFNPHQGAENGVTQEHLIAFIDAMLSGWEYNRSTARPGVNLRALAVFEMPENRTGEPVIRTVKRVKLNVNTGHEHQTFDSVEEPLTIDASGLAANGMKAALWVDGAATTLRG